MEITTIGMFDSGVGGLSVLRQLERLNQLTTDRMVRFIYLGDTARCPYGNRDKDEIVLFVKQIVDWLLKLGADSIVMACNTSAAQAGPAAKMRSPVPVYDLISAVSSYVSQRPGKVAVLATAATVSSKAFSKAITRLNPSAEVLEIACPELVPLVESGQLTSTTTRNVLWSYLKDFEAKKVKSVVLGCTHYPFLREAIADLLPATIDLIDPAEHLLSSLRQTLTGSSSYESSTDKLQSTRFFTTGSAATFAQTATICLARQLPAVEHIALAELAEPDTHSAPATTFQAVSPASS